MFPRVRVPEGVAQALADHDEHLLGDRGRNPLVQTPHPQLYGGDALVPPHGGDEVGERRLQAAGDGRTAQLGDQLPGVGQGLQDGVLGRPHLLGHVGVLPGHLDLVQLQLAHGEAEGVADLVVDLAGELAVALVVHLADPGEHERVVRDRADLQPAADALLEGPDGRRVRLVGALDSGGALQEVLQDGVEEDDTGPHRVREVDACWTRALPRSTTSAMWLSETSVRPASRLSAQSRKTRRPCNSHCAQTSWSAASGLLIPRSRAW